MAFAQIPPQKESHSHTLERGFLWLCYIRQNGHENCDQEEDEDRFFKSHFNTFSNLEKLQKTSWTLFARCTAARSLLKYNEYGFAWIRCPRDFAYA